MLVANPHVMTILPIAMVTRPTDARPIFSQTWLIVAGVGMPVPTRTVGLGVPKGSAHPGAIPFLAIAIGGLETAVSRVSRPRPIVTNVGRSAIYPIVRKPVPEGIAKSFGVHSISLIAMQSTETGVK